MPSSIQLQKCTHQLFAQQAAKTPDATALTCGNKSLTYSQLNSKANQLANKLLTVGVTPDDLIGICVQRSIEMIIGIIGILKAGAAYVPMDPEYPQDRLQYLLEDSGVEILLATSKTEQNLPNTSAQKIFLDSDWEIIAEESSTLAEDNATPENLIYAIYTSGSTGKPKGTLLYHRGFINLLNWYTSEFEFGPGANVLLMSSTSFDLTQKNIFAPLIQGGHLVLLDTQIFDAGIIQQTIAEHIITSINCTPSAFNGIVANGNDTIFKSIAPLKQIFLGGEPIIVSRFEQWRTNPYCRAQVVNSYGPTECTDVCSYYRLIDYKLYKKSSVPIGHPICNTTLHILDQDLQPVATGQEGELCISGAGVGAGYLHRPDLTQKSFVQNPFSQDKDSLLYKTGDRARYLSDGTIEYLGRIDQQVKIRGFRIELGEIEAILEKYPAISEAVVVGRPDESGENRLVAYLVPNSSSKIPVSDVRGFLQNELPDYMLPTAWVFLNKIPLTPNGKIDRNALPALQNQRPEISQAYAAPTTPLEKALVDIWRDILKIDPVGIHDPFFEIGGTSLQSIRFIAQAGKLLQQTIPIVSFFDAPTIAQFSQFLRTAYADVVQSLFPEEIIVTDISAPFHKSSSSDEESRIESSFHVGHNNNIAIIGMAGRFPGAENIRKFWSLIENGNEASAEVTMQDIENAGMDTDQFSDPAYVKRCFPLADVEKFDADFFGYSPREAELIDPQQRLFLENAWTVLEDAGYDLTRSSSRVGIFGGIARNGYLIHNICSHADLRAASGEYRFMLGSEKDFPVNRAAYKLNLTGPAVNTQTACSSSGVALHLACQSLKNGDCDMAIIGGCRVLVPHHVGYIHVDGGTLSADGHLRVFDQDATGMVRGSGGGCLLLKRLHNAQADGDTIHAVIKSSAVNNDGSCKAGFTAPSVQGQAEVITHALAIADIKPESIKYIEAHGTGTKLGDPIEITALQKAFSRFTDKKQFCAVGSVKSNIGHLDAGACVSGIIKTVLALNNKLIPPCVNHHRPNPAIDFTDSPFYINTESKPWPDSGEPRRAGVSSFGLGGTNVHIILEEAPPAAPTTASRKHQLIVLSAKTHSALQRYLENTAQFLKENPTTNLADMAYTLQTGRQRFAHRFTFVADNSESAALKLHSDRSSRPHDLETNLIDNPSICFLFPGQGSQRINMGRDLYEHEQYFREIIDYCSEFLQPSLNIDLREIMFPNPDAEEEAKKKLSQTNITQPALFVIEYALAKLWISWGIFPACMIGHSIGEYTAACLAGVFTLDDALATVAIRGCLMHAQPPGDMLAVRLSEEELNPYLTDNISFAAGNAPEQSVLSGPSESIAATRIALKKNDIHSVILKTSHAFHSSMMDGACQPFLEHMQSMALSPPEIPFISSCTGARILDAEAMDPHYWVRQLREPVRFSRGIQAILHDHNDILLEVGPGQVLSTLAGQHISRKKNLKVITSWEYSAKKHSAQQCTLTALGTLWQAGAEINWKAFYQHEQRTRISLPTYPFERKRYWIAPERKQQNDVSPPFNSVNSPQPHNTNQLSAMQTKIIPENRKETIACELRRLLADLSGIEFTPGDDGSSFLSLGLDSLFLTQVIGKIKKTFGINVKFRQLLEDYIDITRLTDYLDTAIPKDMFQPASVLPPVQEQVPKDVDSLPPARKAIHDGEHADHRANASSNVIESLIAEQLHIMEQQLALLKNDLPVSEKISISANKTPPDTVSEKSQRPRQETPATGKPFGAAVKISTAIDQGLSDQQREFFDNFCREYLRKTAGSKKYTEMHRPHLADPRVVSGFAPLIKEIVYPIVINRSKETRVWDIDGNEYIDMTNAFGANFLGHSPNFITEALQKQIERGVEIGPQHPLAGEVAELVCEFSRMDRAVFCNTGSEAVLGAMRISRTVTGRDRVVVFTNDYHGMFDEVIVRTTPSLKSVPGASGIPAASVQNILVLEYGTDEALRIIRENADDIAAVLVEPVQSRNLDLQPREFLHELRKITKQTESVLILDEVITGFRSHLYGAQAYFDVKADIVTYGKIVGGGMPIGIIAGNAQYMDALDGGMWQYGDDSLPEVGVTYFAGTFVRHPLALAAAKATLEYLKEQGPKLQETLNTKTSTFITNLKEFLKVAQAPIKILHFSSAFNFSFTEKGFAENLFFPMLRSKGIHIFPGRTWFFTTAFNENDFAATLQAIKETVTELQIAGFLSGSPSAVSSISLSSAPLTEPQQEVWASVQMGDDANCAYNESMSLVIQGDFKVDIFRQAIDDLVQKHDSFRITFNSDGTMLTVRESMPINVPFIDLSSQTAENRKKQLQELLRKDVSTPFSLEDGPLLRASVIKLEDTLFRILLTAHHIICDGWAMAIAIRDLGCFYRERSNQQSPDITPEYRFVEYAVEDTSYLNSTAGREAERFWLSHFSGEIPVMDIPTDHPRPPVRTFEANRIDRQLSPDLVRKLKNVGAEAGATFITLLLAAFKAYLYRITNQDDLIVGTPTAGQSATGRETLVGHCVNLLPLRSQIHTRQTFLNYLNEIRSLMLDAYEYQRYTFVSLIKKIQFARDASRIPLVPIIFNMDQQSNDDGFTVEGLSAEIFSNPRTYENFEIFLNVVSSGDRVTLECTYNANLFDSETITLRLAEYETLLFSIASDPSAEIAQLSLLPANEQQTILTDWNNTTVDYPRDVCLHQLFEQQSEQTPQKIAAICLGRQSGYEELNRKSSQLAYYLLDRGVQPGGLIGISVNRSLDMLIALLGILKTGNAYVPLDPAYPLDRLLYMIENADIETLLTEEQIQHNLSLPVRQVILLDQIDEEVSQCPDTPHPVAPAVFSSRDLAYVIYTSGSTGNPKGVKVPHGAVVNFLSTMAACPGITEKDILLAVTTLSFDIAGLELFLPITTGATVVIASGEESADVSLLTSLLETSGATIMQATPATWHMLVNGGWQGNPALKILCGGEALPIDLKNELLTRSAQLWNMYGPTETTIWSTCYKISDPEQDILIGRPIGNTRIYILDKNLQPVPVGIPGELFIGGEGVSDGYLKREELTARQFITDPFSPAGEKRIYRTGDLVRYRLDGNIEYFNRIDNQVKVRGFRIELGEIETALERFSLVNKATVITRDYGRGDVRIIAFYTTNDKSKQVKAASLRSHLRTILPSYMIPQHFVEMDTFPLTPAGKVDRKSLPAANDRDGKNDKSPDRSPTTTEQILQTIWQGTLTVDNIGIEDNFFDLGGHSLLATQAIALMKKKTKSNISLRDFFEQPTIQGLADLIKKNQNKKQVSSQFTITRQPKQNTAVMSLQQQRLWYLSKLDNTATAYNLPGARRIAGPLDISLLEKSIQKIFQRHDILRTSIHDHKNRAIQVITDSIQFSLPITDLTHLEGHEQEKHLMACIKEEIRRPFNLAQNPLFRARIYTMDKDDHVFFFMPHHAIWDGWSFDLFHYEINVLYSSALGGKKANLPDLPIQYSDFAHWQHKWLQRDEFKQQMKYWQEKLGENLPVLELEVDHPRPPVFSSNHASTIHFQLDKRLCSQLTRIAHESQATLFMILLAAYNILLYRCSGEQRDIIVGAPISGRHHAETSNLIGFFVNTLILRNTIDPENSFLDFLKQVRSTCLEGYNHQDTPFEKLMERLNPKRDLSRHPLFQTLFAYQDVRNRKTDLAGMDYKQLNLDRQGTQTDLDYWVRLSDPGIAGGFDYNTDLFENETIKRMVAQYKTILTRIVQNPRQPIRAISTFTDETQPIEDEKKNKNISATPDNKTKKSRAQYAPPVTATEKQLAHIWQDVISLAQIDIHDNFFDIGGHSLLAVDLFAMIKKIFALELPLALLFKAPTIHELAARIDAELYLAAETDETTASSEEREDFEF